LDACGVLEILLVEDNAADAELALHALEKNKVANRVLWLKDGAEALDFLFCRGEFGSRKPEKSPSLVLLDLKLPKIDGLQVLEEIKQNPRTRAIPVVVLTTSKEERDMVSSYQLGVNSYIQKPVNFAEFQNVVRQLGMYWLLLNSKPPASAFAHAEEARAGESER
jgi:two-component system, response regulator